MRQLYYTRDFTVMTSDPERDSEYQCTGHDTSKRLVARDLQPVRLDGVVERKVRHEEENQRRDDALGDRPSEHTLVEQHVVVTRRVQLRVMNRVRLVHILHMSVTSL